VRLVLTEEIKQDVYPAATLENVTYNGGTAISVEDDYYTVNAANVVNQSTATGIPAYQNNNGNPPYNNNPYSNYTANSARLYMLNATTNTITNKTGLGIVLKVMAGDNINIYGKSYHKRPSGSGYTLPVNNIGVTELINAFAGSSLVSGKGVTGGQITGQPGFPSLLSGLIGSQPAQSGGQPRASINWIVFDEQFKWVSGGFDMVGNAGSSTAGTLKNHNLSTIPAINISKNGYIYVWVSNESKYNVFFDNLQVFHNRGPVLEETHYYPFGLEQAGISSKALAFGTPENKYKYNGIEKENDLEIGIYDAQLRELDGQVGRWWQIDPKIENMEMWSPYASNYDNPIRYSDPKGDEPQCCGGFFRGIGDGFAKGWKDTKSFVKSLGTVQGWKNLATGLNNINPMGVMTPEKLQSQAQTGQNIISGIKNVPNMSAYDWGHAIGYGGEKVLETVALSKGTGLVKNGLNLGRAGEAVVIGEGGLSVAGKNISNFLEANASYKNSFTSGQYEMMAAKGDMTAYRVYGGESGMQGSFLTTVKPTSSVQAESLLNINKYGNTGEFVVPVTIKSGTQFAYGPVSGGTGTQIFIQGQAEKIIYQATKVEALK
jgi:RHS repeat-associated protein